MLLVNLLSMVLIQVSYKIIVDKFVSNSFYPVDKVTSVSDVKKDVKVKETTSEKQKKTQKKVVIRKCSAKRKKGYLGKFEEDVVFLENFVEFQATQEPLSDFTVSIFFSQQT